MSGNMLTQKRSVLLALCVLNCVLQPHTTTHIKQQQHNKTNITLQQQNNSENMETRSRSVEVAMSAMQSELQGKMKPKQYNKNNITTTKKFCKHGDTDRSVWLALGVLQCVLQCELQCAQGVCNVCCRVCCSVWNARKNANPEEVCITFVVENTEEVCEKNMYWRPYIYIHTYMDIYIYVYINIYISTLCEIWNSSTCNIKTANYASTLLKSWLFVCTALLYVCFLWVHTPVLHVSCMRYVGDTEETCCKAAKVCFICICTS